MQQYNFWNFWQQSQKKPWKRIKVIEETSFIIKHDYFYSTNDRDNRKAIFFSETKTKSENFQ